MKDGKLIHANCGLTRAVNRIGGKWKPIIIYVIGTRTLRFGQLDAFIPCITRKVLTDHLKELEEDGIVCRIAYKELPPRVDYSLTSQGLLLLPILSAIKDWNLQFEQVLEASFLPVTK